MVGCSVDGGDVECDGSDAGVGESGWFVVGGVGAGDFDSGDGVAVC